MIDPQPVRRRYILAGLLGTLIALVATFGIAYLLITIQEHKDEAKNPFYRVVTLTDDTQDPAVWGKNFPMQYDAYKRTVDQQRTRYGGSEALVHEPTPEDPRTVVAQSKLEAIPALRILWAGYAFSRDFREERGHAYMLTDQTFTGRQKAVPQPGACLNCHASAYVPFKKAGNGDIFKGFEAINKMPYFEALKHAEFPVACIDCHDPGTMQLRITRPAFIEGIRVFKESQGVKNYDVNRDATRQEMRAYVCGQCHVEYYFQGPEKRLTYPWHKGLRGDQILAYYDEVKFKDWTHAVTGASALKAQHPEFEMWNQGIHARNGVACADCHMPYMRVGAMKISDHWVRSPLLNISNACQTCHRVGDDELRDRAETIQGRHLEVRNIAMNAIVELIGAIQAAQKAGATDSQLAPARDFHRKSQFLLDFVEAENSAGFHADQEAMRIMANSLEYSRQGIAAINRAGVNVMIPRASDILTTPSIVAPRAPVTTAPATTIGS